MESDGTLRILCLGDSYTLGEGVDAADSWPHLLTGRLLAREIPTMLRVVAQTGVTAAELTELIESADLSPPYDLVTVQVGVNDQYRGLALSSFGTALDGVLRRATILAGDRTDRVAMISIPDWSVTPHGAGFNRAEVAASIDGFNEAARSLCTDHGIGWVDVTDLSREAAATPELIAGDGLHLAGAMYRRWLNRLEPLTERLTGRWS